MAPRSSFMMATLGVLVVGCQTGSSDHKREPFEAPHMTPVPGTDNGNGESDDADEDVSGDDGAEGEGTSVLGGGAETTLPTSATLPYRVHLPNDLGFAAQYTLTEAPHGRSVQTLLDLAIETVTIDTPTDERGRQLLESDAEHPARALFAGVPNAGASVSIGSAWTAPPPQGGIAETAAFVYESPTHEIVAAWQLDDQQAGITLTRQSISVARKVWVKRNGVTRVDGEVATGVTDVVFGPFGAIPLRATRYENGQAASTLCLEPSASVDGADPALIATLLSEIPSTAEAPAPESYAKCSEMGGAS